MEDISKFKYEEGEMETRKTKKLSIYIAFKKKKEVFCYTHKAFTQAGFNLSNETISVSKNHENINLTLHKIYNLLNSWTLKHRTRDIQITLKREIWKLLYFKKINSEFPYF